MFVLFLKFRLEVGIDLYCNLQLLDEMIDNGFPLTTEPNILREMIAPPNLVNKMLSVVTGNSSNMSDTLPGATSSCIPWRTTDPKYAHNEVYVDLVEEMDTIINRSSSIFFWLGNKQARLGNLIQTPFLHVGQIIWHLDR